MIEIGVREVIGLIVALLGALFGFGRILLAQFEKRMDERDKAQRELRDEQLGAIRRQLVEESGRLAKLAAEVANFTNLMPLRYVQRDDFIRFASSLDHKIDRLGDLFHRYTMRHPPDPEN